MTNSVRRNILRRSAKRQLRDIDKDDQCAWLKWWNQRLASKQSKLQEPPSSQLVPKAMLVNPACEQLFAVIDTCSIIRHRCQLMEYVAELREFFPSNTSPVKMIISLTVLEELDKCNRRPNTAKRKQSPKNPQEISAKTVQERADQPPRSFMRFIEEEMRESQVLISELDPFKKASLGERGQSLEIINKDDRILECCIRAQNFIQAQHHHIDTKVLLVTEDNLFKSKATTFGVPSYRWLEFHAKFKNFGRTHYVCTPQVTQPPLQAPRFKAPERQPGLDQSWYLTTPATPPHQLHQHSNDTPLTSTPHASSKDTSPTSSTDSNTNRKLQPSKHESQLMAVKQRMSNILKKISKCEPDPLPESITKREEKLAHKEESIIIVKEIINIK